MIRNGWRRISRDGIITGTGGSALEMSGWWVAGGVVLLLAVLLAGAWLVTVIVRRSNDKVVDTDTQPMDVNQTGSPPEEPPPGE